jgi:hypothetical protein
VADGVHATVERVETPHVEAMLDRPAPDSQRRELAARHDAVLRRGKGGDCRVCPTPPTFTPYFVVNVGRARHAIDADDQIVPADPRIDTNPSRFSPPRLPSGGMAAGPPPTPPSSPVSGRLQAWLDRDGDKTLGSLVEAFEEKSFAILFVVLLGVPALPLPTGGATHVFEIVAILLALQLIAGRRQIWLPRRWCALELAGEGHQRFVGTLMRVIRRLERLSRPRLTFLFDHRLSNVVFGLLVVVGCLGAFLAPPFTGLDTLPALGVVLLSLGVLLEDFAIVAAALVFGAAGVLLEIVLGRAALHGLDSLF